MEFSEPTGQLRVRYEVMGRMEGRGEHYVFA